MIECSDQPLDISFHPSKPTIVAAGLVDGTIEIHDFHDLLVQQLPFVEKKNASMNDDDDEKDDDDNNIEEESRSKISHSDNDDDEIDTILSSTALHQQLLPSKLHESGTKQASCRAVLFSRNISSSSTTSGSILYSTGTAGDLVACDTEKLCTFSSSTNAYEFANSVGLSSPHISSKRGSRGRCFAIAVATADGNWISI